MFAWFSSLIYKLLLYSLLLVLSYLIPALEDFLGNRRFSKQTARRRPLQPPECEICLLEYSDTVTPRVLSCGHSICYDCMFQMVIICTISCPFCRKTTWTMGKFKWFSNFTKNCSVVDILENTEATDDESVPEQVEIFVQNNFEPRQTTPPDLITLVMAIWNTILLTKCLTSISKIWLQKDYNQLYDARGSQCGFCLIDYSESPESRNPRILTRCGHSLCGNCVQKHMGFYYHYIFCPFCDTVSIEIPKNYLLLEMIK